MSPVTPGHMSPVTPATHVTHATPVTHVPIYERRHRCPGEPPDDSGMPHPLSHPWPCIPRQANQTKPYFGEKKKKPNQILDKPNEIKLMLYNLSKQTMFCQAKQNYMMANQIKPNHYNFTKQTMVWQSRPNYILRKQTAIKESRRNQVLAKLEIVDPGQPVLSPTSALKTSGSWR